MPSAAISLRSCQPQEPANDNRPTREQDRWRDLIDRLKTISVPLALYAIRKRLAGWSVDQFCDHCLNHARAAGWAVD